MAKSSEKVGDIATEFMTDSSVEGFNLKQKNEDVLTTVLQDQREHVYGDGLQNPTDVQGQILQREQKSQEIMPYNEQKVTEEDGTKVTIEDLLPVQVNKPQDDDTIGLFDENSKTSADVPVTMGTVIPYLGLPDEQPSETPVFEDSRPQDSPAFINGARVNLNNVKRPCGLVRFGRGIARAWRDFSRWYDKEMLAFVRGHAQKQANKKRNEAFRQQQQKQQ